MTTARDPKLESYLTALEQVLRPLPVSDRAEIVTEIKSHVLSSLERDPEGGIDSVLAALGTPETVAGRYLTERGVKPVKPPISPAAKWIAIALMGTFGMFLLFAVFLITRFSPIIHVDKDKEKVSILGGLIQIDGDGDFELDSASATKHSFEGSSLVASGGAVEVKFLNGKFEVKSADDVTFRWKCRAGKATDASVASGTIAPVEPVTTPNGVLVDLSKYAGAKCELMVPAGARFSINGSNGKLTFEEPHFSINANLTNGVVAFEPAVGENYRYSVGVTNGKADSFLSSDQPDAHLVSIHLVNGKLERKD